MLRRGWVLLSASMGWREYVPRLVYLLSLHLLSLVHQLSLAHLTLGER